MNFIKNINQINNKQVYYDNDNIFRQENLYMLTIRVNVSTGNRKMPTTKVIV